MAAPNPRLLGRLEEFDPLQEEIATYLERLQLFLDANAIEDSKRVSVLLVLIGPKVYEMLRGVRNRPF